MAQCLSRILQYSWQKEKRMATTSEFLKLLQGSGAHQLSPHSWLKTPLVMTEFNRMRTKKRDFK